MTNYDDHCIRAIASLLKKLKEKAKEKNDRVSILWLEYITTLFDEGGYKYTNMRHFEEADIKKIKLLIRAIEKLNSELHSGKLSQYIKDLQAILERGVDDQ